MKQPDIAKPCGDNGTPDDELLSLADCDCIADVVNREYREIIQLCGLDVALKLFRHFRGCRIDFPKYFYQVDYIIQIAAQKEDRREREKVAIIAGYTASWLDKQIKKNHNWHT